MFENTFGIGTKMMEPDNFEASEALSEHYQELLEYTERKLGRRDMACDLLHDVFVSIRKNEEDGQGYTPDGSKYVENYGVINWIKARICLYAKNCRYMGVNKKEISVGLDNDGDEEEGEHDEARKAYYSAQSASEIELVELRESIPEKLEYLVSLDGVNGVSFSYILTHIQELAKIAGDSSVFEAIRKVGSDACEELYDVLSFAVADPEGYDDILAASSIA